MHQIPEKLDMEKISEACDRVMKLMKTKSFSTEDLQAMASLCAFVHRIKNHVEWIEDMVVVLKAK